MAGFKETAVKLSRNPLGIIALFLVLIYGIACLTFSVAKNFPESINICFAIFILVYPLILLGAFYRLVTKHHYKLYAPEDFVNPEHFMQCIYGDHERELTRFQTFGLTALEPPNETEGEEEEGEEGR